MQQQNQLIVAILAILAVAGIFLLDDEGDDYYPGYQRPLNRALEASKVSETLQEDIVVTASTVEINDAITATSAVPEPSRALKGNTPQYFVSTEQITTTKLSEPTVIHTRPSDHDFEGLIIDVLSIGSNTRPEYLTSQIETWASHAHVRNFWGVTEDQDYDRTCDKMATPDLEDFVKQCRGPKGWYPSLEKFRRRSFGLASGHGLETHQAGWFCAQRRPGHSLGWLQAMYADQENIPDLLLLVDDDTSVDIDKVVKQMEHKNVGGQCVFNKLTDFDFAFGGFGTFFGKEAIKRMTQPIYCDEMRLSGTCAILKQNRIGELDVFEQGDSVFDIFYKYSALQDFCLHSDWVMGYMISNYSGGRFDQLLPLRCRRHDCDDASITCHNQTPELMKVFEERPKCRSCCSSVPHHGKRIRGC